MNGNVEPGGVGSAGSMDGFGLLDAICRRPVQELLPHRPPMVLLDEACGMEGDGFKAKVRITPASPFFRDGGVPAWVGLEYMAQAVAAYSGALGLAKGGKVKVGMLLGTREYRAAVPAFAAGEELDIRVRLDIFQDGGVSSMECGIRSADGTALAEAQINVIEVADIRQFLKERFT